MNALIDAFRQKFRTGKVNFLIEATAPEERHAWGAKTLHTLKGGDAPKVVKTVEQHKLRRNFRSSILHYESNRSITKIKPLKFEFEMSDPWEETVPWDAGDLTNRWQDTQHAIFRKIQSQKTKIANRAIQLRAERP